eukprot:350540-Chlamydomonas_euryale.AAC.1
MPRPGRKAVCSEARGHGRAKARHQDPRQDAVEGLQQRDRPPRRRYAHVRCARLGQGLVMVPSLKAGGRRSSLTMAVKTRANSAPQAPFQTLHASYGKLFGPADVPPGASTKTARTSASITVSEPAAAAAATGIRRAECGASSGTYRCKAAVTSAWAEASRGPQCPCRTGDALHQGGDRGSGGRQGKQAGPHRPAAGAMPLAGSGPEAEAEDVMVPAPMRHQSLVRQVLKQSGARISPVEAGHAGRSAQGLPRPVEGHPAPTRRVEAAKDVLEARGQPAPGRGLRRAPGRDRAPQAPRSRDKSSTHLKSPTNKCGRAGEARSIGPSVSLTKARRGTEPSAGQYPLVRVNVCPAHLTATRMARAQGEAASRGRRGSARKNTATPQPRQAGH